jgi:hypothetical protein
MCFVASSHAFADATSDRCVDANTHAQLLRRSGKLAAAREELRSCADPGCPSMVRDDCTQRLDDLGRLQPTIVFDAKDGAGGDVVAVSVSVDGHLLTDKLDGSPVEVDPGPHTFEFEVVGQPKVTRTLVLKEGEKQRVERVVVVPAPSPAAPSAAASTGARTSPAPDSAQHAASAAAPTEAAGASADRGISVRSAAGLALTTVGVGGIVAGAVYGLLARSAWNKAQAECNPTNCPASTRPEAQSNRETAVSQGTVSTVGFIAGGACLAGGVLLFLVSPSSSARPRTGALRVTPALGPRAASFELQGEF